MKIEDLMLYFVENYINGEIQFINEDIGMCEINYSRHHEIKSLNEDLDYLENLTIDDKNNIAKMVFDEELQEKINENIHYYLYDYKWKEEEKDMLGGVNNE